MEIRCATIKELDDITCVESLCFPASEAASKCEFEERIKCYGNHFWLLYEDDRLISFVDCMVTNKPDLEDDMYLNAAMHNEKGLWQMQKNFMHRKTMLLLRRLSLVHIMNQKIG